MKIKLLLLMFILTISTTFCYSQVRIGKFGVTTYKHANTKKAILDKLMAKPITFVLPNNYSLEDYDKIIKSAWNITAYKVIHKDSFNESNSKAGDVYAQFYNLGVTKRTSRGMNVDYGYSLIDFKVFEKKVKGKKGKEIWRFNRLATIYFTQDIELRKQSGAYNDEIKGDLLNFRLGYLKNFIQFTNTSLKNNISQDLYDDYQQPMLSALKKKTLYIDNTFIYAYNAVKFTRKEDPKIEDIMKDYSFDYEVMAYDQIEEKILNTEESDFYYLMYNQINSNKIITVINGKTGDVVYQDHTLMSFNIKSKDLKKLNKAIQKAK